MIVAFAARPAIEIEFEGDGITHRPHRRLDRLLRQDRAAEIGVEDCSREIEDRARRHDRVPRQTIRRRLGHALGIGHRLRRRGAQRVQRGANGGDQRRAAIMVGGKLSGGAAQHRIDRGQGAQGVAFAMIYHTGKGTVGPAMFPGRMG